MATTNDSTLRFLVAVADEDLRNILVLGLEMVFTSDITEVISGKQAIEELAKHPVAESQYDIVICDHLMENGSGAKVLEYMIENDIAERFILYSNEEPSTLPQFSKHNVPFLDRPASTTDIERVVKPLIVKPIVGTLYCKIRPGALFRMNVLPCDIFIKLSDDKFVKLFQKDDMLSESDIHKLHKKKIDFLYLTPDSAKLFLDKVHREIASLKAIRSDNPANTGKLISLTQNIQTTIHEFVNTLGMTPEVEELVKMNVEITMQVIQKNPILTELFAKLTVDPDNYISSHSIVLSYISCAVASQQEWYSETTQQKLTMASLLHDICLTNEKIAHFRTEAELLLSPDAATFSKSAIEEMLEHPKKAAKILSEISEVPPDVDTIILQHHESPDGMGFPSRLRHGSIAPLSAVFIIAHDILRFYEINDGKFNPKEFLKLHKVGYANNLFQKILSKIPGFF